MWTKPQSEAEPSAVSPAQGAGSPVAPFGAPSSSHLGSPVAHLGAGLHIKGEITGRRRLAD